MERHEHHAREMTHEQLASWVEQLHKDVERLKEDFAVMRGNGEAMDDPLLDSIAVCQILSISYRQLKTYKQRGDIAALYSGAKCLYQTSEVRRFIQQVLKVKGHKLKANIIEKERCASRTGV